MPSVLTHPAVPLALGAVAGGDRVSGRLLLAGVLASVLPDADVLGFRWGVPYGSEFGHRGFSHSLFFAVLLAIAAAAARFLRASPGTAAWFVGLSCSSHGLLDMLTNGGRGVAYFWPVSAERFFFPARVIEVSTLNLRRFFGPSGISTCSSELLWVWLPAAVIAGVAILIRRGRAVGAASG